MGGLGGRSKHTPGLGLTRIEVFGLGELDGGSRLLLQLHDGLPTLADDRARSVAGDQHLQEVFTFLCRGTQQGTAELSAPHFWHQYSDAVSFMFACLQLS